MLTHLFVNPKIGSTTILCSKLISNNNVTQITSNFLRITVELKLRSHLTRSHNVTTITLRITLRDSRSAKSPILTSCKQIRIYKSIRIRTSNLKSIEITTMSTRTKVFHNTNLSHTIGCNQTILLNKPMSSKFNLKLSTTLTRSSICSVEPKNIVIKLSTTHSLPSPLNCVNINCTDRTLTLCQERKRESIIVITISISQNVVDFRSFSNGKISNGFLVRVTTVIISATFYFSKSVHNF